MTKALVKTTDGMTDEQVQLIKNTVAIGATQDELNLFLYTCKRTGLDPLARQIHFVKRKTMQWNPEKRIKEEVAKIAIQTGIDGYRVIAERTRTLAGIDDAVFDQEDGEHPGKAAVTVYRMIDGMRVAFTASARWSEYAQVYEKTYNGKTETVVGPMWKKMPYLMLAKCAEALALRKAFPNDLSGIYTDEEMHQADSKAPIEAQREPERIEATNPDGKEQGKAADDQPSEPITIYLEPEPSASSYAQGSAPTRKCPFCQKNHGGKYDKCVDCYWKEKGGEKLVKKETKTLVNYDAPPFQ